MDQEQKSYIEWLQKLIKASETLTQMQIEACAWIMGGSGCGWTKKKMIEDLKTELKEAKNRSQV